MKIFFKYILLIFLLLMCFSCSCNEKHLSEEETIQILQNCTKTNKVKVTTSIETEVNGVKDTSFQTDYYDNNLYFRSVINDFNTNKTWYGYQDNVLYAFYYTKTKDNEESKYSTRIEDSVLTSVKQQPYKVINDLIINGHLIDDYVLSSTKKNNNYLINISKNSNEENILYKFTLANNKIDTINYTFSSNDTLITIIYSYSYVFESVSLPSLVDYPLIVNSK